MDCLRVMWEEGVKSMTDEDRLRRALLDIVHINTQLSGHKNSYDDLRGPDEEVPHD